MYSRLDQQGCFYQWLTSSTGMDAYVLHMGKVGPNRPPWLLLAIAK